MNPMELFQIIVVAVICGVFLFFLTKQLMKNKKKLREKEKRQEIPPPENLVGFGIRAVAFVIDLLIVSLVVYFIRLALGLENTFTPLLYIVVLVVWCAYYAISVICFGNTVGKKLLKLKIVSATEKPINAIRIALRAFFLITFDWLIFGSGFLLILINKNKQGLHDKVARTYVIKVVKE